MQSKRGAPQTAARPFVCVLENAYCMKVPSTI